MKIIVDNQGISLAEAGDFGAFSLHWRVDGALRAGTIVDGGIELESTEVAWVPMATVKDLAGEQAGRQWQGRFDAMIAKARPHGWIDDAGMRIRAHIVADGRD